MPRPGAKLVLTVHGVSPDRQWQERAARALEPHFQCVPIHYRHYGSPLGAVAVIFNITAVMAVVAIWFLRPRWTSSFQAPVVLIAAVVASVVLAALRRRYVADVVKAQISNKSTQKQPHVIAHSFGTYICGSVLKKFSDIRFGRIVLVGSILPPTFDWRAVHRSRPQAFQEVRNEVGLGDVVVMLIKLVGRVTPDLGPSGLSGFRGDRQTVHRSARPWGPCRACLHAVSRALVHDIFLAKYRHSDWALGLGQARELWLPFLWGYSPREFNEFVECCRDAAFARQEHFWQKLDVAEERLRTRVWTWTRDQTLPAFLDGEIDSVLRRLGTRERALMTQLRQAICDDAFTYTYLVVAEAYEESANSEEPRTAARDMVIMGLNPPRGIAKALDKALDEALDDALDEARGRGTS